MWKFDFGTVLAGLALLLTAGPKVFSTLSRHRRISGKNSDTRYERLLASYERKVDKLERECEVKDRKIEELQRHNRYLENLHRHGSGPHDEHRN